MLSAAFLNVNYIVQCDAVLPVPGLLLRLCMSYSERKCTLGRDQESIGAVVFQWL